MTSFTTDIPEVYICRWNHRLWSCIPFCAPKGRYNCPDLDGSGCSSPSSPQVTPFDLHLNKYADCVSVHLIQKLCILKPMLCSRVDDPIGEVSLKFCPTMHYGKFVCWLLSTKWLPFFSRKQHIGQYHRLQDKHIMWEYLHTVLLRPKYPFTVQWLRNKSTSLKTGINMSSSFPVK